MKLQSNRHKLPLLLYLLLHLKKLGLSRPHGGCRQQQQACFGDGAPVRRPPSLPLQATYARAPRRALRPAHVPPSSPPRRSPGIAAPRLANRPCLSSLREVSFVYRHSSSPATALTDGPCAASPLCTSDPLVTSTSCPTAPSPFSASHVDLTSDATIARDAPCALTHALSTVAVVHHLSASRGDLTSDAIVARELHALLRRLTRCGPWRVSSVVVFFCVGLPSLAQAEVMDSWFPRSQPPPWPVAGSTRRRSRGPWVPVAGRAKGPQGLQSRGPWR